VYAFSIRARNVLLPSHRLIFYVGQAGGGASKNTLRKRFIGYFNESRERLLRFFEDYGGQIDFQYCILDADETDISSIEQHLNDALQPPANQKDFSVEVRRARRANLQ
jgi:hypothetical protein